jgi:very-short-patch-repair endonuclease
MAAVLTAGPRAVLSHRSAAQLWGLLPESPIEIELTRPTRYRSQNGLRAHCSSLLPDEVTAVEGIPVTSVPRTLFDLAGLAPERQLERAFNESEVRNLTDKLSIPDLLERYPRRPGAGALRRITANKAASLGITRNDFEERFIALLDAAGLPRPRINADLHVRGRFVEADCLWQVQRVIVELDGRGAHGTARAFEKDRERDRLLLVEGWRVMRVTWRQLRDEAPAVIADLRRLLRE